MARPKPLARLWMGLIQGPAEGGNYPNIVNRILENMDFDDVMRFMVVNPGLSRYIFEWGLGATGLWQDHVQTVPPVGNVFTLHPAQLFLQAPLAPIANPGGEQESYYPIDWLIEGDFIQPLRHLHNAGFFDPRAYNPLGISYLQLAFDAISPDVIKYMVYHLCHDLVYALREPQIPAITGHQETGGNHLDLLIRHRKYHLFKRWWQLIDPIHLATTRQHLDGYNELNVDSHRDLCGMIETTFAETLRTRNNLNVGLAPTTGPNPGTLWHLAVENTNDVNFLLFLGLHAGTAEINDSNLHRYRDPLWSSYRQDKFEAAVNLLQLGADTTEYLRIRLPQITHLSDLSNEFTRAALKYSRTLQDSTVIHDYIRRIANEIANIYDFWTIYITPRDKSTQRHKILKVVRRVIVTLRAGGDYSRPDLTTVDGYGQTALAIAQDNFLHELYDILEPSTGANVVLRLPAVVLGAVPVGPTVAPPRPHRYPTRITRSLGR
ncbi:hypothetical protein BJX99DRAFT_256110 [Aspergillus californicus]